MRRIANQPFSARNLAFGLVVSTGACNLVGGINEPILDPSVGQNFGNTGGDGGTGGAIGEGGAGGGASTSCMPGEERACYSGPAGTENIGNCKAGIQICLPDGSGHGACMGDVVPAASEVCNEPGDEDCDGWSNNVEVCACTTGMIVECNSGSPGICAKGSGTCAADGNSVDACTPIESPRFDWCMTPEDDDCDGIAISECKGTVEVNTFGTTNPNTVKANRILGVATMPDGGYVIAGFVNGTESSGAGNAYVARVDPDGKTFAWQKTFTASVYAAARDVAIDANGDVIVVGYYNGTIEFGDPSTITMGYGAEDIFITKLSGATGDHQWHQTYGGANTQWPFAVDVDNDGNIFMTGSIAGNNGSTVTFGSYIFTPQNDDIFVLSFFPDGNIRWAKHYKEQNVQEGKALVVLPDGDIVIGCDTNWGINFGGGIRNSKGNYDIALARLRGIDGGHQWSKIVGNAGSSQNIRDLAFTRRKDANGNFTDYVVAVGGYGTSLDIGNGPHTTTMPGGSYVAEFNANSGAFQRDLVASNTGGTASSSVAVDGAGDVILTAWLTASMDWGSTNTVTSTDLEDAYVVKLDGETWAPRWMKLLTGTNVQRGLAVDVDAKGRIVVGGWFKEQLILGDLIPNVVGQGTNDAFVVRLNP